MTWILIYHNLRHPQTHMGLDSVLVCLLICYFFICKTIRSSKIRYSKRLVLKNQEIQVPMRNKYHVYTFLSKQFTFIVVHITHAWQGTKTYSHVPCFPSLRLLNSTRITTFSSFVHFYSFKHFIKHLSCITTSLKSSSNHDAPNCTIKRP